MTDRKEGYVYILTSRNASHVKIGGTCFPPAKRIKEINATEPYKSLGEWSLHDFRGVKDWRACEHELHYAFRSKLVTDIDGQKELFALSPTEAVSGLSSIDLDMLVGKPKVDRMFNDTAFRSYLTTLFDAAWLSRFIDAQGAWTLTLFPDTSGGRFFTLNIGKHEVAYSGLDSQHCVVLDALATEDANLKKWVRDRDGRFYKSEYDSALPRAVTAEFYAKFGEAEEFFRFGVARRAVLAYWHDGLAALIKSCTLSPYARHHNYNAVAKIITEGRI